jgi:hypothetical protein
MRDDVSVVNPHSGAATCSPHWDLREDCRGIKIALCFEYDSFLVVMGIDASHYGGININIHRARVGTALGRGLGKASALHESL